MRTSADATHTRLSPPVLDTRTGDSPAVDAEFDRALVYGGAGRNDIDGKMDGPALAAQP